MPDFLGETSKGNIVCSIQPIWWSRDAACSIYVGRYQSSYIHRKKHLRSNILWIAQRCESKLASYAWQRLCKPRNTRPAGDLVKRLGVYRIYLDRALPKPNVFRRLPSTAFAGMNLRRRLKRVAWPPTGWRILYGLVRAARILSATKAGAGPDLICARTDFIVASAWSA